MTTIDSKQFNLDEANFEELSDEDTTAFEQTHIVQQYSHASRQFAAQRLKPQRLIAGKAVMKEENDVSTGQIDILDRKPTQIEFNADNFHEGEGIFDDLDRESESEEENEVEDDNEDYPEMERPRVSPTLLGLIHSNEHASPQKQQGDAIHAIVDEPFDEDEDDDEDDDYDYNNDWAKEKEDPFEYKKGRSALIPKEELLALQRGDALVKKSRRRIVQSELVGFPLFQQPINPSALGIEGVHEDPSFSFQTLTVSPEAQRGSLPIDHQLTLPPELSAPSMTENYFHQSAFQGYEVPPPQSGHLAPIQLLPSVFYRQPLSIALIDGIRSQLLRHVHLLLQLRVGILTQIESLAPQASAVSFSGMTPQTGMENSGAQPSFDGKTESIRSDGVKTMNRVTRNISIDGNKEDEFSEDEIDESGGMTTASSQQIQYLRSLLVKVNYMIDHLCSMKTQTSQLFSKQSSSSTQPMNYTSAFQPIQPNYLGQNTNQPYSATPSPPPTNASSSFSSSTPSTYTAAGVPSARSASSNSPPDSQTATQPVFESTLQVKEAIERKISFFDHPVLDAAKNSTSLQTLQESKRLLGLISEKVPDLRDVTTTNLQKASDRNLLLPQQDKYA
eukprot:MONOS_2684.1-p1 / transcript=MONOS_2684.1 / gene=MONOS_2684 / organism=Monocercomonoides_exilis_PA203 / gene_product=unspecified product / transcript_product=unspecified product / location=Mono_scaffold00056:126727-128790(+) / protein_length=616 / sequence_SO=supercontig / SO=protein_coding / is_pseudo=false